VETSSHSPQLNGDGQRPKTQSAQALGRQQSANVYQLCSHGVQRASEQHARVPGQAAGNGSSPDARNKSAPMRESAAITAVHRRTHICDAKLHCLKRLPDRRTSRVDFRRLFYTSVAIKALYRRFVFEAFDSTADRIWAICSKFPCDNSHSLYLYLTKRAKAASASNGASHTRARFHDADCHKRSLMPTWRT